MGLAEDTDTAAMEARVGRIRAALVYYIVQFVYFVPQDSKPTSEPLTICVLGEDLMKPYLAATIEGKTAHGRSLRVRLLDISDPPPALSGCHVVFIGKNALDPVQQLLTKTDQNSILSICAMDKVLWGNCMIQIFEERNKARIAIDVQKLQEGGLRASSELLEVAIKKQDDS